MLTDEEWNQMVEFHKKEREQYENQNTGKNSYQW